jgi:hypothetical protein
MKKVMQAEIRWVHASEGGKTHFPIKWDRYNPLVEFENDIKKEGTTWSSDMTFLEVNDEYSIVEFSYLVDEAPYENMHQGHKFKLFEGPKLVARGIIL